MTNSTESMTALLNDALADYIANSRESHFDDTLHPFHIFAFNFTRAANAELTHALAFSAPRNDFATEYYFSDSIYDEITNPLQLTSAAAMLFDLLYDADPDDYPDFAETILDSLNLMLSYHLISDEFNANSDDLLPTITSLSELNTILHDTYKIAPTE